MKNMKVSTKLILSFSLVAVLTIALVVMGLLGMRSIKSASDDMYTYNIMAVDAIGLIRENFANQRYTTRELIIYDATSDKYRDVKEALKELEVEMDSHMALYSLTMQTEEDFSLFERFQRAYYDDYFSFKSDFISLTDQNEVDAVMEYIQTVGKPIVNDITAVLQEAHDYNAVAAKEALAHNTGHYFFTKNTEIVILVISLLFVVFLIVHLRNLISKPMISISNALGHMGNTGDLKFDDAMMKYAKVTSTRKDEIGLASLAIINLLNNIWNIENTLSRISDGDFSVDAKTLSDRDTLGISVSKVVDNLNRMFRSMKEAEEAAQTASKAKSTFLAHISHEIRTPLNAITGMAAIAKNARGDQAKTVACIDQILVSSRHLLSILNNVLDMSKIESGKLELINEPFSLHIAFNEVYGIISQGCTDKSITFTTNYREVKDTTLIGDKMRINQVLINLLGNAVKFTPSDGNISFMIYETDDCDNAVRYRFAISDSGIGMSNEQITKLFAPFEQTRAGIAAQYGGTGLGLSISQNLVAMMGGVIKVESELNVGTEFSFELSFEKSETVINYPTVASLDINLSGKRILLVEDVEINRIIVCEMLLSTGVEIHEAEDGKQALDMYENNPANYYDLVLMDVQMPVMDGYEATKQIRLYGREDAKTIPIVAMTANAYKEDIDDALAAGMNAHLAKPIDMELLITALVKYIK